MSDAGCRCNAGVARMKRIKAKDGIKLIAEREREHTPR